MEKCNCYHTRTRKRYISTIPVDEVYGVCYGTRECEECFCNGNTCECDFYPEKRKEVKKTMRTAEMYLAAQENGKTYVSNNADAIYSKSLGLVEQDNVDEAICLGDFPTFGSLMECEWEEVEVMTKAEAEKKFRIKIVN